MAKKKELHVYKQRNGYDNKKYITDTKNDPDFNLKVTEPGQAISVRKLVERYEKGAKALRQPIN